MNKPLLALVFVENGDTLPAEGTNAVIDINGHDAWYEFESEQDRLSEDRDRLYLENEPIDAHHDEPDLYEYAD